MIDQPAPYTGAILRLEAALAELRESTPDTAIVFDLLDEAAAHLLPREVIAR